MNRTVAIEQAVMAGDVERVREAFGNPPDFPNVRDDCGNTCLDIAIWHGPVSLVRELIELGADPNYPESSGFPSLFAAIDRTEPDRHEVLAVLLAAGTNVAQRGTNDFTALHLAACRDDAATVEMLLLHGADTEAKTRIDDYETPLELAERFGHAASAAALRRWIEARKPPKR